MEDDADRSHIFILGWRGGFAVKVGRGCDKVEIGEGKHFSLKKGRGFSEWRLQ